MGDELENFSLASFVSGRQVTRIASAAAYYVVRNGSLLVLSQYSRDGIIGTLTLFDAEQARGIQKPLFYQAFEPSGYPKYLVVYDFADLLVSQMYFDFEKRVILRNRADRHDTLDFVVLKK